MSNCQHTAVHIIQYATSCCTPHTPTQNVQPPTHSSSYNSVSYFRLDHSHSHKKMSNYQNTTVHFKSVHYTLLIPPPPNNSTLHVQQPTYFSSYNSVHKLHLPLTIPLKMSNYQYTAVHTIHYDTSCRHPHTPTKNVQLITHSST